MKIKKLIKDGSLFYFASFCFNIAGIITFITTSKTGMGAAFVCLGSSMLCLGTTSKKKTNKQQ